MESYDGGHRWTRAELIVLAIFTLIGAAILGPAVLRAASNANEAQAIADTRAVLSAENSYAAANGGFFSGVIHLCRNGGNCSGIGIPNYSAQAPEFLRGELGRSSPYVKEGYVRRFTEGPRPLSLNSDFDGNSVIDFCYDSVPETLDGSRSFSGDSTGHIWQNELGEQIACPIPPSTQPLDADLPDELVVDFGSSGLWHYDGVSDWSQLTAWDPVLVRTWGEKGGKIGASFGPGKGVWMLQGASWTQLTNWDAYELVGQGDELLLAFDAGRGLWSYDTTWSSITEWEPELMIAYGNKVAFDFGSDRGLWLYWHVMNRFVQTTSWDASLLFDFNGELMAAFDGGRGMWGASYEPWVFLPDQQPWAVDWQQLTGWEPQGLAALRTSAGPELAGDYGPGRGIWITGTQLTSWDPYLLTGHDGDLLAAFDGGRGLYRYQDGGGWTQLTTWEPTQVVSAETYLAVAFGQGRGVYRYDATGWTNLTSWTAESLTVASRTLTPPPTSSTNDDVP